MDRWWMDPGADEDRPLMIEEAGEWLRLQDLGYPDPCATLREWVARGRIDKGKLGNKIIFTLAILRNHVRTSGGPSRAQKASAADPSGNQGILDLPVSSGRPKALPHVRQLRDGTAGGGGIGDGAGDQESERFASATKLRLTKR